MFSFAVLLLCIQACLVQNECQACPGASVMPMAPACTSPCGLAAPGRASAFGLASGLAYDGLTYPAAGYGAAAYGGSGEGNVAVFGELPVTGNTAVAGQVPIMGAVSFNGPTAAAGCVSISGKCACGAEVADVSGHAVPCRLAAPVLAAPCGKAAPAWGYDGLAYPSAGFAGRSLACDGIYAPAMEIIPTSGGALPVSSYSAMAPVGISVESDNAYEGLLAVEGELPFVSAVALEGVVPSAGAGAVNHACGNGRNAMISETAAIAPAAAKAPLAAYGAGAAFAPAALAGSCLGLRSAWAGRRCGCAM